MKMGIMSVTLIPTVFKCTVCICTDVVKAAKLSKKYDIAIINVHIPTH